MKSHIVKFYHMKGNMQQSTFKRNAKVWGPASKEMSDLFCEYTSTLNKISLYFWKQIKNKNIIKINRHTVELKNKKIITDTQLKDTLSFVFSNKEGIETFKRSLVKYVMERYRSYINRNKKNTKSPIRFHNYKSIYFKDNFISLDKINKNIKIQSLSGPIFFPFYGSLKLNLIKKEKFGGNLKISKDKKSYSLIVAAEKEFHPKYKHKCFIAYDLNKDSENWIYLSDAEIIKRPAEINSLIEQVKKLNNILNEKNLPVSQRTQRSKQRKKTRIQIQNLHKELNKQIIPIANKIIEKTISKKAVLCIDSIQCGKKTGTFGQDHLKKILITRCQNEGIPYYVIPTPFTTQKCSKCGCIFKENKLDHLHFECVKCGYKSITHKNASINIRQIGKDLYKNKMPFGDYSKMKIKKEQKKENQEKETLETFFS